MTLNQPSCKFQMQQDEQWRDLLAVLLGSVYVDLKCKKILERFLPVFNGIFLSALEGR